MINGDSHHQIPPPDLRIVPTSAIYPHEDEDSQRAQPLTQALRRDGLLRNPIIVTPLAHGMGYLLLDGTNRYTAFRQLTIEHILVQAVPYRPPAVELASWNHVIGSTTQQAFVETVTALSDDDDNLTLADSQPSKADVIARIHLFYEEATLHLTSTTLSLPQKMTVLRQLVNAYMSVGRLNRSASTDHAELQTTYPDVVALVEFMTLTRSDITTLTQEGHKVPAGVTRHIIQGRALRVNYPLSVLRAAQSLSEKNEALKKWVSTKFADRNVRLYTEATYQFEG
jgi:hypothetical protein